MAKHTPGPWIWGEGYRGLYGAGPNNTVLDHAAYEGMWVAYGPSMDANACLIAAAPELLEALRELDGCYCEAGNDLSKEDRHRHRMTLIKARSAIEKATGQCLKGEE